MKIPHPKFLCALATAGALWTGSARAAEDLVVNTFDSDTSAGAFWLWWGGMNREVVWDGEKDAGGGASPGSVKFNLTFDNNLGDNQYAIGFSLAGSAWNGGTVVSPTDYSAVEFDILWDPANTVTPEQINSGHDAGFNMGILPAGWSQEWLSPAPTLTGAATWQRITVPIPVNKPSFAGLIFKKWQPGNGAAEGLSGTFNFWIDNIKLIASDAPPPVPSLAIAKSDARGVKFTANAGGQYQRQNIAATSGEALATWWVDNPEPVTYSLTLVEAPKAGDFQNHLFLVPDSSTSTAPDYSDPTAVFFDVRQNADGTGNGIFRYKVNQPNGNAMIFGEGTLANLGVASPLGVWSLRFQNNTNITITGPGGASTNFNMSAEHAALFRPTIGMTASFGIQPNQNALIGQSSVFGEFKITVGNTTVLQDPFTTVHDGAQGPVNPDLWTRRMDNATGIAILTSSGYQLSWGVPDAGYSLLASSNLNNGWYDLNVPFTLAGSTRSAFVATTDLPAGGNGFFVLQQRTATRLQVLLPGETAAPGTPTGKTGTPTPQAAGVEVPVIVNAVNDTWHKVNSVTDTLSFSSTDETAQFPANPALVNGSGTFNVFFGNTGSFTISVSNLTGTEKAPGTSSTVTVQ